jgi:hypothetical protein
MTSVSLRGTARRYTARVLHQEVLHCQEQLHEITKGRQPLVIKKRGSHAYISGELPA